MILEIGIVALALVALMAWREHRKVKCAEEEVELERFLRQEAESSASLHRKLCRDLRVLCEKQKEKVLRATNRCLLMEQRINRGNWLLQRRSSQRDLALKGLSQATKLAEMLQAERDDAIAKLQPRIEAAEREKASLLTQEANERNVALQKQIEDQAREIRRLTAQLNPEGWTYYVHARGQWPSNLKNVVVGPEGTLDCVFYDGSWNPCAVTLEEFRGILDAGHWKEDSCSDSTRKPKSRLRRNRRK